MSAPRVEKIVATVPRIALRPAEAASALGVSTDYFDEHIAPELRAICRGKGKRRLRLYPVAALQKWADENAALTLREEP